MVLEIFADSRRLPDDIDAEAAQPFAAADPRQFQQMGRADGAGGEDDLAARRNCRVPAVDAYFRADGAAVFQQHALGLGAQDDSQIGPSARRAQEGLGRVDAHAAPLVDLKIADAQIVAAVEIADAGNADGHGGVAHGVEDRPMQALFLDAPLAAAAVTVVGAVHEVLVLLEIGQHIVPAPAGIAELAPVIVVAGLAAHVDHAVDRGAAAEHLAARIVDGATAEPGLD